MDMCCIEEVHKSTAMNDFKCETMTSDRRMLYEYVYKMISSLIIHCIENNYASCVFNCYKCFVTLLMT